MSDLTLVIMAAGMGNRFGGLKQIEPVGPNGEFIIDYSIYDAKKAGFNKVVFIIKEENYDIFRETVGKRFENEIEVEYVFQKFENVPEGCALPEGRVKPWGTSQAILAAKNAVKGNFAIINADDFYGRESYQVISDFFEAGKSNEYLLVGYQVANTLSENGAAKRGVCETKNGYLEKLTESSVEKKGNIITAEPLIGGEAFEVKEDNLVAMNMFGFTEELFDYLEKDFKEFFIRNKDNMEKCEWLIPDTVCDIVEKGITKVKVVPTVAKWQGITYREDKEALVTEIAELIEAGVYPKTLSKN